MKDIRLKRLSLRDFKGMTFTLEPDGQDMDIYGRNATGKTTLADAFSWLLFGKDSLGRADFEIKNLDSAGNSEHGLDHEVEAVLDVNSQTMTLKKVYHEIWTKKRGSAQKTLTGNTTDHYIDGVPIKEGEYKTHIAEIAGDEAVFRLLTSPAVFPSLPWQKQRSMLLEICGNVTVDQVIATDESLFPLTDLLQRYTVSKTPLEDLKKVVTSRRSEINKHLDQLPVRIDEVKRSLPDVTGLNLSELGPRKLALEDFISACQIRLQGIDNGAGIADLTKKLREVEFEIGQLQNKYYLEGMKAVTELKGRINEYTRGKADSERKVGGLKGDIAAKQTRIALLENELNRLREKWTAIDAEKFVDTTEDTCPACGQALPADRVQEARDKALAHFNNDKAERLFAIETRGKEMRAELERVTKEVEDFHVRLMEIQAVGADDQHEMLIAECGILQAAAEDYGQIPGRAELLEQKADIEKQIEAARAGISQDKETIQKEIDGLTVQLREVNEQVDRFTRREHGEKRIEELKVEERALAKEFEELEKQLFMIENFTKRHVSLLNEQINRRFNLVRFKLYNELMNGGIEDCCEISVDGVGYNSGLNNAARINAGLDVITVLQKHYKLSVPVFVDNAESVVNLLYPECQMIRLIVSATDPLLRAERSEEIKQMRLVI